MWPTSRKGIIAMNRKTRNLLALQASKFRSFRSKLWWEVELTKIYRRCRIFLLSGELEMRILWDSWCHAHACKMPREIINCPLYPAGLGDTTESLYFLLLLCITIRLRPLGILISNHLSFNLPSGHAIRFFRLSNIDASWPDILYRMSWLKRDIAVNGSLIA